MSSVTDRVRETVWHCNRCHHTMFLYGEDWLDADPIQHSHASESPTCPSTDDIVILSSTDHDPAVVGRHLDTLRRLVELERNGDVWNGLVIDFIFVNLDCWHYSGQFQHTDEVLSRLSVADIPVVFLVSYLTITHVAHNNGAIQSYADFYSKAETEIKLREGNAYNPALLHGLEP